MFHFAHPENFIALVLALLLAGVFRLYLRWKKRAEKKWSDEALTGKTISGQSHSNLKFWLPFAAILLLITALADPQVRSKAQPVKHEGIDVALLMDASESMLAEDVKPNRLEAAKQLAGQLTDEALNERIALISFASDPFTLLPLTQDHAAVKIFLQSLSANAPETQGTDIGAALLHTIRALPENQNHYKAIVLLSDGEDQENQLDEALKLARENNVVICTVGIGTEKGTTIPDSTAAFIEKVKHDIEANIVITRLHPETLKHIAERAKGVYVSYVSAKEKTIPTIMSRLNSIKRNTYDEKLFTSYQSLYQWLLIAVLLLLMIEFSFDRLSFWKT
jgi:Ca-activated chloride channel family protein